MFSPTRPLPRHSTRSVIGALTIAFAITGCSGSVSIGDSDVAESEVETVVAEQLAATVDNGVTPNIDCPGDLKAEVGATITCTLTVDGDETSYPVTVEVTEVNDGAATFSAEVGEVGE